MSLHKGQIVRYVDAKGRLQLGRYSHTATMFNGFVAAFVANASGKLRTAAVSTTRAASEAEQLEYLELEQLEQRERMAK